MATLDGFTRVPLRGIQSGAWTSQGERDYVVTAGLMDPKSWDLPNRVPLGYLSRQDASGRENRFSQPALIQAHQPTPNASLVPLRPHLARQTGATTDGIHLLDSVFTTPRYRAHELYLGRTRVPIISDANRFQPYRPRTRIR